MKDRVYIDWDGYLHYCEPIRINYGLAHLWEIRSFAVGKGGEIVTHCCVEALHEVIQENEWERIE